MIRQNTWKSSEVNAVSYSYKHRGIKVYIKQTTFVHRVLWVPNCRNAARILDAFSQTILLRQDVQCG